MSSHRQTAQEPPRPATADDATDPPDDRTRSPRVGSASGFASQRLARKNLGLLCGEPACPQALTVYRAAIELGARVSLVNPRFDTTDDATLAGTGRILDRLYDAVVCVGLAPDLVRALRRHVEIPVLDEASVEDAPGESAAPAAQDDEADGRLFRWQAVLVDALA